MIDLLPMTSYCAVVTMDLSRMVSEINGDFCRKSQISPFLSLSLQFNGHLPGEPGLAGVY